MSNILTIPLLMDGEDSYTLCIILQQGNIDRIKAYDPAEIDVEDFPREIRRLDIKNIQIMYATKEEMDEFIAHPDQTYPLLKKLARGWQYRPDLGDHDNPPESLGPFYFK